MNNIEETALASFILKVNFIVEMTLNGGINRRDRYLQWCAVLKLFAGLRVPKMGALMSRLHMNEKSRHIPLGASVWNLQICLISLRWQTSFFASPDFSTATLTSSSEWPGLIQCCAVELVSLRDISHRLDFDTLIKSGIN